MPQKHKRKLLNFYKLLGLISLGSIAVIALTIVLIRPFRTEAGSSMEINGNGVLVRYNTRDGATEVGIPQNVRAIGDQAFMGAKNLERLYITGNVEIIGDKAFYGCDHLREVIIDEGTRDIKDSAFAMCTSMSKINLPRSLKNLGNGVFAGDTSLYLVTIDSLNTDYFINDNVIYNRNSTKLVEVIPGRQGESYEMPFTVKSISPYAFWGATNLKSVRVSNQVNSITPFAFTNATGLEYVYLPNSVKSIQEYAFRDCKRLKTIAAEGKIGYIADSAFTGVSEKMEYTDGVSYDSNGAGAASSSDKESGDSRSGKESENEGGSSGEDGNVVSNGGDVVFNTPWGISAPYKEIDTSDPNLYGTGRIVGGKTYIIPTGN